jgi:tetratricopeptide (TPR) repeat protein
MNLALLAVALSLAPPSAPVAERTDRRIAALATEALALRVAGQRDAALAQAEAAMALAERDPGPRQVNLYVALDALRETVPDQDYERQYAAYARFAAVATAAKGADSYAALAATTGRNMLGYILRKPGASIAAVADPLARAMPIAPDDVERARTAGWAMFVAQLYDSTGQHPRALEVATTTATFFNTPPATPNRMFGVSMGMMAQRYADWQDWAGAILAADRAIAASQVFHGRRTTEITGSLKARGRAYAALGRYADAERDYREAVALADTLPNPVLQSGTMFDLAKFYVLTGRDALAVPILERTAERARANPPQSNTRLLALIDLYNAARRASDDDAALRHAMAARADGDARGLKGGANYVTALFAVANASIGVGQIDVAARILDEIAAMLPRAVSANNTRYADLMVARGRLAADRGDFAASAREYRDAVAGWEAHGGDRLQIAETRIDLAQSLARAGDAEGAWRAARSGGDGVIGIAATRVGSGNAQPLDHKSLGVFDATIDTAWAVRRARR